MKPLYYQAFIARKPLNGCGVLARDLCKSIAPTDPVEALRLTALGQICAAQGLDPDAAGRLRPWLEETAPVDPGAEESFPALCALALSGPAELWPAGVRPGRSPIAGELRRWFAERELAIPTPLVTILDPPGGPAATELAALEAAWRLTLWIGPDPTDRIERRTGWPAGTLARVGEALAWVAAGAAALTLARGGRLQLAQEWRTLATRLAAGVTRQGAALAALRLEGLGRTAIQSLCAAGLSDPAALAEVPLETLVRPVGDRALARALREAAAKAARASLNCELRITDCELNPGSADVLVRHSNCGLRIADCGLIPGSADVLVRLNPEPAKHQTCSLTTPPPDPPGPPVPPVPPAAESPLIELDLQSPGVIRVAGRELRLTPLSFDLLAALAECPGRVLTRAAIYHRLWPEGGPEDQQLDAHRRRLGGQLAAALGGQAGRVVELVRGVGFRLNIPGRRVQVAHGAARQC